MAKAWTTSDEILATESYLAGGIYLAIEKTGRTKDAIKTRLKTLGVKRGDKSANAKPQTNQSAYKNGYNSRVIGKPKGLHPFSNSELCLKHWWLAGWHDKDMEIKL